MKKEIKPRIYDFHLKADQIRGNRFSTCAIKLLKFVKRRMDETETFINFMQRGIRKK